jgi:hypothetical protein
MGTFVSLLTEKEERYAEQQWKKVANGADDQVSYLEIPK